MEAPIVIVFFKSDNSFEFEVLHYKQGLHFEKEFESLMIFRPEMLKVTNSFCLEYLDLEERIMNFYYDHPSKMDKNDESKVYLMQKEYDETKMILHGKIQGFLNT